MNATLTLFGKPYKVFLRTSTYHNGATAVEAFDAETGDPFVTLSVNIVGFSDNLPPGAFYAKHWSENDGLPQQLVDQGIFVPVNAAVISSDYVSDIRAYRLAE